MVVVSQFNGTSTPKGLYSAKTGDNDCNVNSSRYSLSTALCVWDQFAIRPSLNKMSDKIWYPVAPRGGCSHAPGLPLLNYNVNNTRIACTCTVHVLIFGNLSWINELCIVAIQRHDEEGTCTAAVPAGRPRSRWQPTRNQSECGWSQGRDIWSNRKRFWDCQRRKKSDSPS